MSTPLGQLLYESMYPGMNHRPWCAIDRSGQERFQRTAEAFTVVIIDALGVKLNEAIPLASPAPDYSVFEIGAWLERVQEHVKDTGDLWVELP